MGVKLKARVQKRTEEEPETEKSVSPPRLKKKKKNVSTRGNYKVDKKQPPFCGVCYVREDRKRDRDGEWTKKMGQIGKKKYKLLPPANDASSLCTDRL